MRVCPRCDEENPERARFCLSCGAPLSQRPARKTRKVVTAVFTDVVSSTQLSEKLDPETLRQVMTRYFTEVRGVIVRHGGRVEKFIGDAVMGTFGVPVLNEDDALRAVRAAVEIDQTIAQLNEEFDRRWGISIRLRIGVNTGEVVASEEAGDQALVAGDAVIAAARLQQVAQPGQILIGETTFQLVKDHVEAEPFDPPSVKGKKAPTAFTLTGLHDESPPVRAAPSPLIGRDAERSALLAAFGRAVAERRGTLVTVVGWPGIGKSRLVADFLETVGPHCKAYGGRCLSYGHGITFWPIVQIVNQLAGLSPADDRGVAIGKIRAACGSDPRASLIAEHVGQMVGLGDASLPATETFWALRALLEDVARDQPLVVILEDIHWGEATLFDLIEYLTSSISDAAALIVCTARPELLDVRPEWTRGAPRSSAINLDRLSDEESLALIETLIGGGLPPQIRDRVRQAAEGNPLYIEQLISSFRDQGLLGRGFDGADLSALSIPPTINALIAARLDRLPDEERAVLDRASVIGKEFSIASLKSLCGDDLAAEADRHLDELVRRQMVQWGQLGNRTNFRFQHALIRETAYTALPKEIRGTLHETLSRWMANAAGDRASQFEEVIGFHLEQASRYVTELEPANPRGRELAREAATRLASAGRRAFARDDTPAAINLLERASQLLEPRVPERLSFLPELAEAYKEAGNFEAARKVLDDAQPDEFEKQDVRLAARLRLVSLDLDFRVDPARKTAEGRDEVRALIEALEVIDDAQGLARAWNLLGHLSWWRGQFVAMADASLNAIDCAERCGDVREETWAHTGFAIATAMGPTPVSEGITVCEQILGALGQTRMIEARTLMALALLRAWNGEFSAARTAVDRARVIHEDMGLALRAATDLPQLEGAIEMLAGNAAVAEQALRRGQRAIEEIGGKVYVPMLTIRLAQSIYAQGRYDEADRLGVEVALETEADSVFIQVWGRTLRAKLFARRGEIEQADELAQEAVAISDSTDHLSMQGDALVDQAEVLLLTGRTEQAGQVLRSAIDRYGRKGNVVGVRTALLLQELSGAPSVEPTT